MGCFSHVSLVLILLSILTHCSGLPYWLRRTTSRHPGNPTRGRGPGAHRMPLGTRSTLFQPGSRTQSISGRNKLFMDHLQLSLNRGHGSENSQRAPGHARKRPSKLRLPLSGLRGKGFDIPRIEGMKTFSSHRSRQPMTNIRHNPFLTRLGKLGHPSGLPSIPPKGGHRKRQHNVLSEGPSRIESNPLILTYDSPALKQAGQLSQDEKYVRDHSFSDKDGSYLSPEEFFAQNPSSHLVPCDRTDRHKCLNGGLCVYVGALDVKTCRCPLGYTGRRCEMVDQEYLVSLYSNSLQYS